MSKDRFTFTLAPFLLDKVTLTNSREKRRGGVLGGSYERKSSTRNLAVCDQLASTINGDCHLLL